MSSILKSLYSFHSKKPLSQGLSNNTTIGHVKGDIWFIKSPSWVRHEKPKPHKPKAFSSVKIAVTTQ